MPDVEPPLEDMPPRTKVDIRSKSNPPLPIIYYTQSFTYTCIDCGFATKCISEMRDHQKTRSIWHRIGRWWHERQERRGRP